MQHPPGSLIKPIHDPTKYTDQQIQLMCTVCVLLDRGLFVWTEEPKR